MVPTHEDSAIHTFLRENPHYQRAWLRDRGLPEATLLALHNSCAQRCFFCAGPGTVAVPEAEWTSRGSAMAQMERRPQSVRRLLIGGNEPTLHPDFLVLLNAARGAGFESVDLMTNGRDLAANAESWHTAGLTEVVVPLYAANAALHDEVCGAVVYDQVVAGLDAAHAIGISVRVHALLLRRTLSALPDLARMVRERWGTRLGVGLLRDKGSFDFTGEAPAFDECVVAVERIPEPFRPLGIGTPACLPTFPEAPPLLADLYFRTQAKAYGPACDGCSFRANCSGAVAAYTNQVRPPSS